MRDAPAGTPHKKNNPSVSFFSPKFKSEATARDVDDERKEMETREKFTDGDGKPIEHDQRNLILDGKATGETIDAPVNLLFSNE